MRGLSFLAFVVMTIVCWGIYGPILHEGQIELGADGQLSRIRALRCVGISYFLIAVLFPLLLIRGEAEGKWSVAGMLWSSAAGALGALGALGLLCAFKFGGTPIFVMPLVFGCAPVINTIVTMMMGLAFRYASLMFYLGVLVVAIGSAGVMFFKPQPPSSSARHITTNREVAAGHSSSTTNADSDQAQPNSDNEKSSRFGWMMGFIAMTALCWGSYGPVQHRGQMKLGGSRMRPFLFVGLAYFAIAVAVPLIFHSFIPPDPGRWTVSGAIWSLAAGATGAIGALGIVFAFNVGGKPIFVMPLVFGGAPVINTISSTMAKGLYGQISIPFCISLFLVIVGAVTVIVCAPRAEAIPSAKPPRVA